MESRYLGSDESLAAINKAAASVYQNAVVRSKEIYDSVNAYLETSYRNNERLGQLIQQNLEARANAAASPSGLAALANAGLNYLLQSKKQQDEYDLAKMQQQQKIEAEKLKQLRAANYIKATEALGSLIQDFYDSGAIGRSLITDRGEITGSESFRQAALRMLTEIGDLEPNDRITLLNRINEVAQTAAQERQRKLAEGIEKQQAARAEVIEAGFQQDISLLLSQIKNAGVTQQAAPFLEAISLKIKEFMAADNGLTEAQKLNIAAGAIRETTKAYGVKADAYAKYNTDVINFQAYAEEYQKARLEYLTPNHPDEGNLDAFKAKITLAAAKYGDWSKNLAGINEAEKLKLETINLQLQQEKIKQNAAEVAGKTYPFSDAMSVWIAANAISNPYYAAKLESSPYADNPAIKTGLWLAAEYKKFEEDNAKLQTELAGVNTEYARLDLRRLDSLAAVLKRLALNASNGTTTPGEQELINRLSQAAPEVAAILELQKKNPGGAIDMKALNDALKLESDAITQVQQSLIQEYKLKQQELIEKYRHLEQAGLLTDRKNISSIAERNRKAFQAELDAALQYVNESANKAVNQPKYGITPNFNGSSTYAPDVDESGRVIIAPRSRLQTITVGGKTIPTPIKIGARAPITSNFGDSRSGQRKHAGVDFAMEGSERAVALVGGVAHVFQASGYGGVVDIVGDNGYVYRYAHQRALVKNGQRVKAGQEISYSDGSGIGAPHLHFEVRNRINMSNNKYQPSFGFTDVVDPIEHLAQLDIKASNVTKPRAGLLKIARAYPHLKAPPNSHLTHNGVINANTFQLVGQPPKPANSVYTSQRPLTKGTVPWTRGNSITYDYGDSYGYSVLQQNPQWRRKLVDAAKALKVPAHWLADIIQQESSWNLNARSVTGNFGLFGFDPKAYAHLRGASFEKQMDAIVEYYKQAGWDKVLARKGAHATIADLWILSRAGVVPLRSLGGKNMRQFIIDGGNPYELRMNDLGTTFGKELELLGKWVGRKYSVPSAGRINSNDRISRNKAVDNKYYAPCSICESLQESGSWVPHIHDNLG